MFRILYSAFTFFTLFYIVNDLIFSKYCNFACNSYFYSCTRYLYICSRYFYAFARYFYAFARYFYFVAMLSLFSKHSFTKFCFYSDRLFSKARYLKWSFSAFSLTTL